MSKQLGRIANYLILFAAMGCLLASIGCGGDMVKAAGELRVDGKLVDNATITFYPVGGGRPGSAFVGEGGTFEVSYYKPGDGLPPGDYKVAIIADKLIGRAKTANPSEDEEGFADARNVVKLVPQVYNNIQTTPLTISVTDSSKPIKLDISSKLK